MSLATPIKIEPKHIYEYNTNIVNNNKIDYVKLTEYQVSMPQTEVLNNSFVVKEKKVESSSSYTYLSNYINKVNDNAILPINSGTYYESGQYATYSAHRYIDILGGVWDKYLYYKIEIDNVVTLKNYIKLYIKKNMEYGLNHNKTNGFVSLSPSNSNILDNVNNSASNSQQYVYFNRFSSIQEFENRYIADIGATPYFLINFINYSFCGGIVFEGAKCTLMFFIKDHRRNEGSYYDVLTNFDIQLELDIYKSEAKTYTFTLDNGVLKNVDEMANFNYKNKKGYTLPDSPLLTNLTVRTDLNNKRVALVIAENILTKFKNGKQTASMTVNCIDYYDTAGNKIIGEGVARKTLEAGDYVIPYIKADEPLAKKKDGTPKKFEITSAEFTYEGLAQKHLKMVEVVE